MINARPMSDIHGELLQRRIRATGEGSLPGHTDWRLNIADIDDELAAAWVRASTQMPAGSDGRLAASLLASEYRHRARKLREDHDAIHGRRPAAD